MTPIINIDEEGAKTRDEEVRVLVTGFGVSHSLNHLVLSRSALTLTTSLPSRINRVPFWTDRIADIGYS